MNFCSYFKCSLFIVILSYFIYFFYNYDDIKFSLEKAKYYKISRQLHTHVLHQHKAVGVILKNLLRMKDKQWQTEMFVMPFVGTAGVSKTYVANVIKSNYYQTYVHDVTKNDLIYKYQQTHLDILKNLQDCCNLVIIDDLTSTDIDMAINFIAALPRHKVVLAIPIFNTQLVNVINNQMHYSVNDECLQDIIIKLKSVGQRFECVFFHVLNKSELESGILQLMIDRGVDYAKCGHLVKEIVDEHDVLVQGYKQLHLKLNIIWECGFQNLYKNPDED